jgi:Rrf2 family iron-sulfur cluster assembly transcriptional regulator
MTHDLWVKLNDLIFDHLGAVSLKQLVDEQKARHEDRKLREKGVVQMLDMRAVMADKTMAEKVMPERDRAVISA